MAQDIAQSEIDALIEKLALWQDSGVSFRERHILLVHLGYLGAEKTEEDVKALYRKLGFEISDDPQSSAAVVENNRKFVHTMADLIGLMNRRILILYQKTSTSVADLDTISNIVSDREDVFDTLETEIAVAIDTANELTETAKRRRSWV